MRGITILPSVRWPRRKGAHPYPARLRITDALAALPRDPEPGKPVPTFTPALRGPDRATRPIPGLALAPGSGPAAAGDAAGALLRRVHDGMTRKWSAETFCADKRELPVFAAMTRQYGMQGLHMPARSLARQYGHERWTVERWHRQSAAAAEVAIEAAFAELDAGLAAARERVFAPRAAA